MRQQARSVALLVVLLAPLAVLLLLDPIPQSAAYHDFADRRSLLGIPNFADVVSNLAFLAVGLWGLSGVARWKGDVARRSWQTFFCAMVLLCFGSAWYHLSPDNETLVWDRLAISVACSALLVALLAENAAPRIERFGLLPALVLGAGSVVYWHASDDLRAYIWVQLAPLLAAPALVILFPARYSHRSWLLLGLAAYVAAKLTELADSAIFHSSGGLVGGHTAKHLLAALAAAALHLMLLRRRVLSRPTARDSLG